jgi:putative ABC transport system permease protein
MRFRDLVKFAWKAMTDRKLRTSLTIIGIVIGPATIVALLGATQGFSNAVGSQFVRTGATSIFVNAVGRGASLTSADIPVFQNMTGVEAVAPYFLNQGSVGVGGETSAVQILSINFSQLNQVLPGLVLANGSYPIDNDLGGAVIGNAVAYPDVVGASNVTVNGLVTVTFSQFGGFGGTGLSGARTFVARGIFAEFGQGFLINPDNSIFVSLQTGQTMLKTSSYTGVVVVATSPSAVNDVINEITNQYGSTVRTTAVSSILSTIQSVTNGIGTILGSIGGVSVLVAFIGIMTTMFTTVVERTKEIGVLKAIGYSSGNILSVFMVEALVTGFLGGVIGAAAGTGLSFFVISFFGRGLNLGGLGGVSLGGGGGARSAAGGGTARAGAAVSSAVASSQSATLNIVPVITPELILFAVGLASAVGLLAGLLPAWRASRLTPVEALRKE